MKYKIEHNVPFPEAAIRDHSTANTVKQMKVGDSFVCEDIKRPTLYSAARFCGYKITIRKTDNEGEVRVWRVR